jgi:hypothetical protein
MTMKTKDKRAAGFVTNIDSSFRHNLSLRLAGWLHGLRVEIRDDATAANGKTLRELGFPDYRALYITGGKDLSDYWRTVGKIDRLLRVPTPH